MPPATLKLAETVTHHEPRQSLLATFYDFVLSIDRGNLADAIKAQEELEQHGFKVTYRRNPSQRRKASRDAR